MGRVRSKFVKGKNAWDEFWLIFVFVSFLFLPHHTNEINVGQDNGYSDNWNTPPYADPSGSEVRFPIQLTWTASGLEFWVLLASWFWPWTFIPLYSNPAPVG